ncbi:hypothetical protein CBS101457_003654 [Exobasidium rhododendri]|nr:hypothetical protein CBS101457_003654 [Exobasidium rhododendri]
MSEIKRLHISGLNPTQCSVQDLQSRFQSFQLQVRDIHNWPPGNDGVGDVQAWCFLTVEGEASKIKRATDLLNNTIWKGSKLRIGLAKKQAWAEEIKEAVEVEPKTEKEKKKKKKRKPKGVESERIDHPITDKEVTEGEWGWKKTPAGHLLRPLHMRPSHPLPRPTSGPVTPKEKDAKRKSKGAVKKPMTRTRRVTIDPSRYGAIHLSGVMLDDGTEGLPAGAEWECEESIEGGDDMAKWILRDVDGNVLKEEIVQLREEKIVHEQDQITDSDSESEDTESDSSMDEVAAAINNAAPDSSDSEEEEEVEEVNKKESSKGELTSETQGPYRFPSYDPGEDSDFSEGYQEMQPNTQIKSQSWKEEKAGHLDVLKNMFGDNMKSPRLPQSSAPVEPLPERDESEDDDMAELPMQSETVQTANIVDIPLTGVQKRAALLGNTKLGSETNLFRPLVRFVPSGSSGAPEDDEVEDQEPERATVEKEVTETSRPSKDVVPIFDTAVKDHVQMSSLKDMFRPKEASVGFSLMGDLDLDLEEEGEEEEEEEEEETIGAIRETQATVTHNRWVPESAYSAPASSFAAAEQLPFFFPTLEHDKQSWLKILQSDSTVSPFCKDKSDEELQALWKERKGQLTQDYKRRHREALKKKRRKYTGSRAAGTSMPMRS